MQKKIYYFFFRKQHIKIEKNWTKKLRLMVKIKTRNILLIWVVLYILKKKILSFFSIFFNFSIDKTVIFIPFLKLSGSFDSNNRTLITLSGFFSLHFDQMDGTLPMWSHYPTDPIIRDPIKRSLLYIEFAGHRKSPG